MTSPIAVEIVAQDPDGVRIAQRAGASRVELCTALGVGGLSPSLGLIEAAVGVGLPVHVLIRPRAGGFIYTQEEVDLVGADIQAALNAGASGVVVGALTQGGNALDLGALTQWRALVGESDFTVHRCVDVVMGRGVSPEVIAQQLITIDATRVLTSGGAPQVGKGLAVIGDLVASVGNEVEVMAGGGARIEDIPALRAINVHAVHLSARTQSTTAGPTGPGGGDEGYDITDATQVEAAVRAATT